jgi:hypothetical protein
VAVSGGTGSLVRIWDVAQGTAISPPSKATGRLVQ